MKNTRGSFIKPIPTIVAGIKFDSKYESQVYLELVRRFGSKNVEPHFELALKPKTDKFPRLDWKVDFKVTYNRWNYFYEAKGYPKEEFILKVKLLEWINPSAYASLFIVCSNNQRSTISRKTKLPLDRVITKGMIQTHQIDFLED